MNESLAKLEKRIDTNTKAVTGIWYQNSLILLKIRHEGLHKAKYGTFENYLEERWGYSKSRGHQLMNSAEFIHRLTVVNDNGVAKKVHKKDEIVDFSDKPIRIFPANEGQIRPLLEKLSHDGERIKVWRDVVATGEKPTAALVQRKVEEFISSGEVIEDVLFQEATISVDLPKAHVANNSGVNEWYTPAAIIESARLVMGGIDTDPATSELANRTVGASQIFTAADDGRAQQWSGNVWMNPPYAQPLIGDFADAVTDKYASGEIEQATILVNNATETRWFQRMLEQASAVCFPASRIRFIDPEGKPSAPLQGQAIVYMGRGDSLDRFIAEFRKLGSVMVTA